MNVVFLALLAVVASALSPSCATSTDGTGSESHFACRVDSDCDAVDSALVCVGGRCIEPPEAGASPGADAVHSLPGTKR